MLNPNTHLKSIPKILPKYLKPLEKLGLRTVRDLLFYFPFRYDDFSKITSLSEEFIGQTITVEGTVSKTKLARIFRRKMTIAEIIIQDENNVPLKAVWFNQHFILEAAKEGTVVRLSGKLEKEGKKFLMKGPAWERASREATNTGILVPVYSETKGITSKWIRWQLKMILERIGHSVSLGRSGRETLSVLADPIPSDILQRLNLYDIHTALLQIHFPDSQEKLLRAQKRFAFEEMFLVQLKTLQVKKDWEGNDSIKIDFDENLIKNFVNDLPFKLTDAQRKASFEILKDLEKPKPMNRLLNGDVGSGKTVVAAIAALQAMKADYQVAIMAPTEVLAKQHFESFCELFFGYDFNISLLTNSYKLIQRKGSKSPIGLLEPKRQELLKNIYSGQINLTIGTHALIQKDVKFKNLALVIIDEQHRFGVAQRAALQQAAEEIEIMEKSQRESASSPRQSAKQVPHLLTMSESASSPRQSAKQVPHLLTMTATPIPRTLAIALFGSLELSILDEMPKNRKPIITKIVPPSGRKEVYNFIAKEVKNGRQIFVILPLIEESKALTEVKAATTEHKKLSEIFPDFKIGLLHGRLKSAEKEQVMQEFKEKKIHMLVSTSVVEVGIDIPNASVMIIEDANRFGLSQLHQFRGRVGRGEHQSYCFLFSNTSDNARLKALEQTNDGFEIAEKDLALRGPGQFFGLVQSGIPDIAMKNLNNIQLIKYSRAEAQNLLRTDPELKNHPSTKQALLRFSQNIHLE